MKYFISWFRRWILQDLREQGYFEGKKLIKRHGEKRVWEHVSHQYTGDDYDAGMIDAIAEARGEDQ